GHGTSGAFTGGSDPVPKASVPSALGRAFRQASWTLLALMTQARPRARILKGHFLLVGDGLARGTLPAAPQPAGWEATAIRAAPRALRSRLFSASQLKGQMSAPGEARLAALAQASVAMPLTCLVGSARNLLRVCAQVKQITGRNHVTDIWPHLSAVVHSQDGTNAARAQLVRELRDARGTSPVLFLEACLRPEGAIAIEDPRFGCLRLLANHGVYFEFVPVEQLGQPHPARLGMGEIEPGVRYALAMTSPAGLWACLVGLEVCF